MDVLFPTIATNRKHICLCILKAKSIYHFLALAELYMFLKLSIQTRQKAKNMI